MVIDKSDFLHAIRKRNSEVAGKWIGESAYSSVPKREYVKPTPSNNLQKKDVYFEGQEKNPRVNPNMKLRPYIDNPFKEGGVNNKQLKGFVKLVKKGINVSDKALDATAGRVGRLASTTVDNMKGAGKRWDEQQANKNENYLKNLKSK